MRTPRPTITSLPLSPDQERHARMVKYAIAMGIRVVCIGLCVVVPGWWALVPAAGAVFLPYFAVLIANQGMRRSAAVARPGALVRSGQQPDGEADAGPRRPEDDAA